MTTERVEGSYSFIAAELTARFKHPVSRQQVYMWRGRRDVNGFPDEHAVQVDGKEVSGFYLDEVVAWYDLNYPEARRERLKCQNQARKEKQSATDSGGSTII